MSASVLHVFPDSVLEPGQAHLGSTKDIRGRTQYFAERGLSVDELSHERSAAGMLRAVRDRNLSPYEVVMVEFPLSGRAMRHLRREAPGALLMTRSENAELLHRLDWMRAIGPSVRSAKLAARTALTTTAELWAGRMSDAVLSISAWEAEHYWPRLTRRERVHWLPYYVPDSYLPELLVGDARKDKICVCLTSTKRNPLIEDSVRGFERAVAQSPEVDGWRFLVTGDTPAGPGSTRVEHTGMLASPGELLRSSRAVALLSDLGYGFKTKLLEAVVAGNRVLVTPGLYRRIPDLMHPWTVEVDLDSPPSFTMALVEAEQPVPEGDPNQVLREQHHAVLDHLIDEHSHGHRTRRAGHPT